MRRLAAIAAVLAITTTSGCSPYSPNGPETDTAAEQLLRQLTAEQTALHPPGRDGFISWRDPWPTWETCTAAAAWSVNPSDTGRLTLGLGTHTDILDGDAIEEANRIRRQLQARGYTSQPFGRVEEGGSGWVSDGPSEASGADTWAAANTRTHNLAYITWGQADNGGRGHVSTVITAPCTQPPDHILGPAPASRAPATAKAAAARRDLARIMTELGVQPRHITHPDQWTGWTDPAFRIKHGTPLRFETVGRDGWYATPCGTGYALAAQLTAKVPGGKKLEQDPGMDTLAKTSGSRHTTYSRAKDPDKRDEHEAYIWHLTTTRDTGTSWSITTSTDPDNVPPDDTIRTADIDITTC